MNLLKKLCLLLCCIFYITFSSLPLHASSTEDCGNVIFDGILSDYAILMDKESGTVYATKKAHTKMYPASMTKMMTAYLILENTKDLSQKVKITKDMVKGLQEENASIVGYTVGDIATVEDILYGIALVSGADACNAGAILVTGSIDTFVSLMNEKASYFGMKNTHFTNPSGLHNENHYSTVEDIALLLRECLKNETFAMIFSTHTYTTRPMQNFPSGKVLQSTIFFPAEQKQISLPGLIGGKTGFTNPAGHCLASWSKIGQKEVIIVTSHADTATYLSTHLADLSHILDTLCSYHKVSTKGDVLCTIQLKHRIGKDTIQEVKTPFDIWIQSNKDTFDSESTLPTQVFVSNKEQSFNGTFILKDGDTILYTNDLHVRISKEKNFFARLLNQVDDIF